MSAAIAEPPAKPATEVALPAPKPPGEEAASFLESLNGESGERKKPVVAAPEKDSEEKTKAETDVAEKAKSENDAKAKPAPVAKRKVATPPAPPAEPDYEKIAEAAGRGVAAAIKKTESESKADDPIADLSSDEREWYEAYSQMEKDYPEDKGLAKKYLDSLKEADAWEEKWLESHPGEELSEDNAEYKAFVEKNEIRHNELRLQKSLARIEAEKMVKADRDKGNAEVEDLKRDQKLAKAMPAIIAQRAVSARAFFSGFGDDFEDVLDEAGNINRAAIGKILEADPLKQIALTAAEHVEGFADELYRLSNALTPFDANNGGHSFIASFVAENENYLEQLPADEQAAFVEKLPEALKSDKAGRRFATAEKYARLTPAQRAHYFRLQQDDIAYLYAVSQVESVKKSIAAEEKRIDELATKRGFKKVDAVPQMSEETIAPAPKPAPAAPLPPSPSGAIEPRQALPSGGVPTAPKNAADSFTKQWLG